MNDPEPGTLKGGKRVRQMDDESEGYPRASEILDSVLRTIVFSTLGVVPFNA